MAKNKKLEFFLVSDIIEGSKRNTTKDKQFLNNMKAVIESHGHKCKVVGVDPNLHTQAKENKCTKNHQVWVCVVGGVWAGTLRDMASKYQKEKRKDAYLVWAIRTDHVKYNLETLKYLKRAKDDNFSPGSFKGLNNPVKYMNKNNIGRVYGSTPKMMADNLCSNQIGHVAGGSGNVGKIFSSWSDDGLVDTNISTDKEETQTYGFDTSTPFQAYIKILYSVDKVDGKKQTVLFDFTSNAPDKGYSFTNDKPILLNNEFRENRINVLEKLEQMYNGKHKFYIHEIWLEDYIPQPEKDTTAEDKTKSDKLYDDKNDFSSYKLLISECGFCNFESVSSVNLGLSGKTLLDGVKECVEKTNYLYKMRYGKHRYLDHLDFYKDEEFQKPTHTYSQGYDGNILEISGVNYNPLSSLKNNSIVVFKSQKDSNDESTIAYDYVQSKIAKSILKYGEYTILASASDTISSREAYYQARTNKEFSNDMEFTYTITVLGYDGVEIMDWVETLMNRKYYNDVKRVHSIEINGDVNKTPSERTTLGLGAIDRKMRVQKRLIEQRKKSKHKDVEVSGGISFNTDYSFLEV